jgi:hypothetical protein
MPLRRNLNSIIAVWPSCTLGLRSSRSAVEISASLLTLCVPFQFYSGLALDVEFFSGTDNLPHLCLPLSTCCGIPLSMAVTRDSSFALFQRLYTILCWLCVLFTTSVPSVHDPGLGFQHCNFFCFLRCVRSRMGILAYFSSALLLDSFSTSKPHIGGRSCAVTRNMV